MHRDSSLERSVTSLVLPTRKLKTPTGQQTPTAAKLAAASVEFADESTHRKSNALSSKTPASELRLQSAEPPLVSKKGTCVTRSDYRTPSWTRSRSLGRESRRTWHGIGYYEREWLRAASLAYEEKHNSTYRYSKLNGKTPLTALARLGRRRSFPTANRPRHPLEKPGTGCYHLVRFIRSDCHLNIFSELFSAPQSQYESVVATINIPRTKLKLLLGATQVAEYDYQLR